MSTIDNERMKRVTAAGAYAVTPSDSVADPKGPFRSGLFVTVAGNLKFSDEMGNTITLASVPAFTRIPIGCSRVWSTGTAATVLGMN